ncbi:Autophagy protein 5 [Hondaea fermentalgiana]|uniref:Autophagy protein 5 n=1 Tax=Hondaea fermentalgiana TaxID=2315210 RepID=A0A2R5G6R6_9STRA|nr:Autophagy protein 5 [Hondaea fermentalgiana]|eukprot:GBG26747.1 Autophagy protein 5 [Hondaea fermentalgiana]
MASASAGEGEAEVEVPRVVRASWRGGLPVLVEGVDADFEDAPLPAFSFASRQSFLPFALAEKLAAMRTTSVVPARMQEVWFEAQGVALKWQYPLGALFDVLYPRDAAPLRITIHLRGAGLSSSEAPVVPCPGPDAARKEFFHLFKQGMFLRYNSRLPFTELRENDDDALWESVLAGEVDRYWFVLQRMHEYVPKAAPVRILQLVERGNLRTVASKQIVVPLDSSLTAQELVDDYVLGLDGRTKLRCQGIDVPSDALVVDLYESLAHADMFLYICLYTDEA